MGLMLSMKKNEERPETLPGYVQLQKILLYIFLTRSQMNTVD